ncbi:MAG: hypothetical protein ABIN89_19400 [Chitinophagaceae bacterium]
MLLELQDLRQKAKSVQIVLSSRYEISFTWAEGFHMLELLPLNEEKVEAYLQARQIFFPPDQRLRKIMQNPMMLTLFANVNEIIERYKGDKQFDFKPRTTTQGELIWNFMEAQVVTLFKVYNTNAAGYYYHKFMIRHFL